MLINAHKVLINAHKVLINAHKVLINAHKVLINAHKVLINAHKMLINAHKVLINAHKVLINARKVLINAHKIFNKNKIKIRYENTSLLGVDVFQISVANEFHETLVRLSTKASKFVIYVRLNSSFDFYIPFRTLLGIQGLSS